MRNRVFLALIILSLCAGAARAEDHSLQVVSSEPGRLVVELIPPQPSPTQVSHNHINYQRLRLPGYGSTRKPGSPELPFKGALIGVSQPEKVAVKVLEAEYEDLSGYLLYPAPRPVPADDNGAPYLSEEFCLDQEAYATDVFYPEQAVKISQRGYMRDQAVVKLDVYPAQYNPKQGLLRYYKRMIVELTWPTPAGDYRSAQTSPLSAPYEQLLQQTILNYDQLDHTPRGRLKTARKISPNIQATQPAFKLAVEKSGLYRLTGTDLQAAGMNIAAVDPLTLKVANQGRELAVYVEGEGDGILDPTDYLEFYGEAINTKYTNTNIYWLTSGGLPGRRMAALDGQAGVPAPVPAEFQTALHLEEDHTYWGELPGGEGKDLWFWTRLVYPPDGKYDNSITTSFNVPNVSSNGNCTITVLLQGRTNDFGANPDHRTRVKLNGNVIDDQWWDGQIEYTHQAVVPQTSLLDGMNTITVESLNTGASVNSLYLNWIGLEYGDTYTADNNALEFSGQTDGRYQYEIDGFSSADIDLFEITDPISVQRIINYDVEPAASYKAVFQQDEGAAVRWYLGLTEAQRLFPAGIIQDEPSSLASPANGADYIIITYDSFYSAVQPLANYRAAQGLRVITAKMTDVYDEFSYGLSTPEAIQNFLSYAYDNWEGPSPAYVVLIGDATMDYKDNYGFGGTNYVPAYFMATGGVLEAPSDNWYVCVSGTDFLPDMFIGRISVRSAAEVTNVVNKIIGYEQTPPTDGWNKNILLIADDDDPAFEAICDNIMGIPPVPPYLLHKVYIRLGGNTSNISNRINNGALMTAYAGHGNQTLWGVERIFDLADIAALSNSDRLTWVSSFTCLDGYFTFPATDLFYPEMKYCMAEKFVQASNKGAVASFSPTAYGFPSEHKWLGESLYRTVFEDNNNIIGPACTIAKIKGYSDYGISGDNVKTYMLFGDPATALHLIFNPPAADFSAAPTDGSAPLEVSFTDLSTGVIDSWEWDFNNDAIVDSTEQSPIYTYTLPGTYTVSLTVSGPGGSDTKVTADYITVAPAPAPPAVDIWLQEGETPAYHPGDTMNAGLTITAGAESAAVDLYVRLRLPSGKYRYYHHNTLSKTPAPLVKSWTVSDWGPKIFYNYTFAAPTPPGAYEWQAAFTKPGAFELIGALSRAPFNFTP